MKSPGSAELMINRSSNYLTPQTLIHNGRKEPASQSRTAVIAPVWVSVASCKSPCRKQGVGHIALVREWRKANGSHHGDEGIVGLLTYLVGLPWDFVPAPNLHAAKSFAI